MPDDTVSPPPPVAALVTGTVFVFHDGSPDQRGSLAAARGQTVPEGMELALCDRILQPGDRAARNRAIRRTRGSYIAVIDSGSVPDSDWLAASVAALRDDPTLGMIAAGSGTDTRQDHGVEFVVDPSPSLFVARRSMWDAIGGFDEAVDSPAQGLSLGWRCWLLGWRAGVLNGRGSVAAAEPASRADLEHLVRLLLRESGSAGRSAGQRRFLARTPRGRLQRARRRSDSEIGRLLQQAIARGGAAAEARPVLESAGAGRILGSRRSIVVATADTLAPSMAGPGIRAWQIATALAEDHDVHLVTTGRCDLDETAFPTESVDDARFADLVGAADLVLFQGWVMADRPWLVQSDVVIVADVYDPMHLEQLEHGRDAPAERGRWDAIEGATRTLNQQLRRGDYFLCASAKQRDLWLGQLAAVGRINQVTYDEDNAFHDRLRVVPFGIEDADPSARRHAIRDLPGIGPDAEVVLWGGGIYNWFDPITLIRAIDALRQRRPAVRLYFLGTRHPNPEIPEMRMAAAARDLADELGLVGSHVFFNDGWVPYAERADYLLDADIAVSIHRAHVETEFSFRTRLLDYLWCGLPIVATGGDSFEPLIADLDLGVVVPPGDVTALERALEELLSDPERRARAAANARKLAEEFRWSRVLDPVREICRDPARAPDVACPDTSATLGLDGPLPVWRDDLALARRYLAEGGIPFVVRRLRSRMKRLRG